VHAEEVKNIPFVMDRTLEQVFSPKDFYLKLMQKCGFVPAKKQKIHPFVMGVIPIQSK